MLPWFATPGGRRTVALTPPGGLVLFEFKIRMEEKLTSAAFSEEYPRYRERVPQLIPGLRIRRVGAERKQRTRPPSAPGPFSD